MFHRKWFIFIGLLTIAIVGITGWITRDTHAAGGSYKILAWNDLGMHCYNSDFANLAVLPPYNNLWVQVVKVADPPELVTSGIKVEYYYADNTYSAGKTNFWDYEQALFGVNLPTDVGLKGKGLSGTMDLAGDHFVAEGIPITEYSDSAPTVRQPYQLATVVVKDAVTGAVLTSSQVVTPTSSEMRCDKCHSDTGIAKPSKPTGKVETNILQLHDEDAGTTLMASRPVLCASCHASNALGAPGKPGIKSLSNSMHEQHTGIVPDTLDGCYNCHPGPQTHCLRDVMSTNEGMTCVSCHGGLSTVANNPNPWLNEPRCDSCHNSGPYNQDQPLYRFSRGHGGLYCESCHDSTHAIAPSREANDAIKFNQLQGRNGPLQVCSVCHATVPTVGGPHSSLAPHINSILRVNPSPTSLSAVSFTVTFSATVTGVDKSDFRLTTTGVSGASITTVTGAKAAYTVEVNTGSGNGTIRLDVIDDDSIRDANNLPLGGPGIGNGNFTVGQSYTISRSPNVQITGNTGAAGATLSYIDGTTKTSASGNDGSYSLTVPINWSGTVTPSHPCYTFNPASRSYNSVTGPQPAQDYTATFNSASGCANVKVTINGTARGNYGVSSQDSLRQSYPGVDSGPVQVTDQNGNPLIASERINLKKNNAYSSYSEIMGIPSSKLSDTYLFPWYNNTGLLDSQIRFGNVGNARTTVTIKIAGVAQPTTYDLDPNQSARVSFAGVDGGPVEVKSSGGVPIIAALRINLKNTTAFSSYAEILGMSASNTASTRYIFPWYNYTGLLDSQLRFGNVGSVSTTVTVKIGGVVQGTYPLAPKESKRISYAGLDAGPVEVTSSNGVPIIAAMRINLKSNNIYSSYTELMGQPGVAITETRYLFPWYNNTGLLDSQLRFANVGNANTTVSIKINGVVQPDTYTLKPSESMRVSILNVDNGPVEVYSSGNVPIIAALRINLKKNSIYSSYHEFMGLSSGSPLGLPGNQLSTTYWFPWYNNTNLLDSQLRFGMP